MIEIQIHPSDIRRKVRYFFLGRRGLGLTIAASSMLLFLIFGSMIVAPSVIRRVYKQNFLRLMRQERIVNGDALKRNLEELEALEKQLVSQRVRVAKLATVYGLNDLNLGQGGFSLPASVKDRGGIELKHALRLENRLIREAERLKSQLEEIDAYERRNSELIRHVPSILPVPPEQFVLTSPFGSRISPFTKTADFHKGLDLAAPTGTAVYATADGVVTFAGRYPMQQSVAWWRFGNVVTLNHADRFVTIYAHCDQILVKAGQRVKQGDRIATVGNTGWSTNSHLHYEVRSDLSLPGTFEPIDPRIYILDYQWNNEEKLLIEARKSKDYKNFDPLPSAFIGRRRV
jgi:murein DD-endopeptidase MepM/ murein hydrolase activator NlpD